MAIAQKCVSIYKWLGGCIMTLLMGLMLSACGTPDDYSGHWMALDDSRYPSSVYTLDISQTEGAPSEYTIYFTRSFYEIDSTGQSAAWTSSSPNGYAASLDRHNNLVGSFGTIDAKPGYFELRYGQLHFTRKAKNTELKLKYVARDQVKAAFPDITIYD